MKKTIIIFSVIIGYIGSTMAMPANSFLLSSIEPFTESNQLSNSSINCMAQDTTGFLWIGTPYGLNKYDGSKIKTYYFTADDSTSIADNYIQQLYLDSEGVLWVLVPRFFCKYDEKNDCFVRYRYSEEMKNTHTSNPGAVTEDNAGKIWIGTPEMGLYCFNREKEQISFSALKEDNISEIYFDGKGKLWIGSVGKMFVYDIEKDEYISINYPEYQSVVKINPDKGYLLTRTACYFFNPEDAPGIELKKTRNRSPYQDGEILDMLETEYHLWFGTKGRGLIIYEKSSDTFHTVKHQKYTPTTISNNSVKCLFKDRSGVIWIGTSDGLDKFNPHRNLFSHYLHDDDRNSLLSNIVTGFAEDKEGNIWISTYDGISKFHPSTETFTNFSSVRVDGKEMNIQNIRDITKDHTGNLWFSHRQGLFKLDTQKTGFYFYELRHNNYVGHDVLCTYPDGHHHIWAGTYGNGIFQLNAETNEFAGNYNTANSNLSSDFIKDIIQLDNGCLCFATLRTGIDIYDPGTSGFINIRFSPHTHNYVSDYINHVYQDSKKNLWVLSWHGVFVLSPDYELIHQFTTENNIIANELTAITEDAGHDIWLGSINGVSRISFFSGGDYHISNYTTKDGLASNNISTGGLLTASDQAIYLGSSNGFNVFHTQNVPINFTSVAPTITNLHIFNKIVRPQEKINGQVVLDQQITLKKSIYLNHRQKIISLDFSSLDFSQNKKLKYAYKLENLDKEWVVSENESNSASYSNLYPGKYTFRVKSENSSGIWSDETVLDLVVAPPYWATWWAYCLYVLFITGAILITIRIFITQERLKQNLHIEKLQHEKENEINDIKLRFYTNISHDIRTPLTLITGPLEHVLKTGMLSESTRNQLEIVKGNASYLLTLINQLLDFRKVETDLSSLKASPYDMVEFANEITLAFEPYALQNKINLNFSSKLTQAIIWFDPQLISKVFYNIISNALKFTPEEGTVTVHVDGNEQEVILKIKDTGIGINPEEQGRIFEDFYQIHNNAGSILNSYTSGSGIGLTIVKKYVNLHHGRIEVDSEAGKGSTFTVYLKKGKDHFEESQIDGKSPALPKFNVSYLQSSPKKGLTDKKEEETADRKNMDLDSVLIVDDNPDIISFVTQCLGTDFFIYTAENAIEGMQVAEKELPDIIISDIMMPGIDGFSFAAKLKESELTRHIPILFLTAKSSLEDTVKGLKLGASDYITKPFDETILLAKIKNLILDRTYLKEKIKKQYFGLAKENEWNGPDQDPERTHKSLDEIADPFLLKVLQFIRTNIEEQDLTSDLIERHFKISKIQLYRKLKAVSGLSVVDIIRISKVNRASELLIHSDLNISEIAYQLGFSDPFYFSKTFKKETGLSPAQYRKDQLKRK